MIQSETAFRFCGAHLAGQKWMKRIERQSIIIGSNQLFETTGQTDAPNWTDQLGTSKEQGTLKIMQRIFGHGRVHVTPI
jgi:hypothetical protein